MRWFSFTLTGILILLAAHYACATLSGSLDEKSIEKRLKPEAEVTIEGGGQATTGGGVAAASAAPADVGQQRYEETCKMCHETGLAGAPKFGDKKDWAPRIAEGMDTLYKHAIQGFKAMPPKGSCTTCSDEEIQKAVDYMISHSK